jgi:ribonuclease-3
MLRRSKRPEGLAELIEALPEDLRRQAFTHASWVDHRSESYERLAFLGDVVLSLAVSDHLFPRFERYGAGRLTKVRAQAVSGPSCARVARDLGVPDLVDDARARLAASLAELPSTGRQLSKGEPAIPTLLEPAPEA